MGDRPALSLLVNALDAHDAAVRAEAAEVLGLLLEPSVRIQLAQRLHDPDGYVRLAAALALAKMQDPSARAYLLTTLQEDKTFLGLFAGELLSNLGTARRFHS
ncbi:MAG: HEAT repeat domain-containing protein [Candidatus Methylomirabilis sp.]|nr:HEAT repeat domain-containing protein [Candidatus Methylomirabilis sp.]